MADRQTGSDLADSFDRAHAARLQSSTLERLWHDAFGNDYPVLAQPNAFYSLTTLVRFKDAFGAMTTEQTMVDLGCGYGSAGLWLAEQLGIRLVGIDLSPGGVALARERATGLGIDGRARFQMGDMVATGLPSASCDAAICLDVLLFLPDQAVALRETARILRSGSRFAFTTWEQTGYSERLGAPQTADYRPVLDATGFDAEIYEEPLEWRRQQRELFEAAIAHERELVAEMGAAAATSFLGMVRGAVKELPSRRYVLGVARRR